jgi:hypothetical protein
VRSIRTCVLQEDRLYGVNKGLSVIRRHVIWGQYGPAAYKKARYKGSIKTCLLQEDTLYGVNKDLSLTRKHVIWGQ